MSQPTETEFRAIGYTKNAINFPLSEAAVAELCTFNGIAIEQLPNSAWRYAPNAIVQAYWERKAKERNGKNT